MAGDRWIFTKTQLMNTPSRKNGIDGDKELDYRQQAANLIQDMGQRLQVNQLCINTAIVYMHRFYMFQSFTRFHRNVMAPASLFLAAKVEEQLRKLEHVLKVAHLCLHREGPPLDVKSEVYLEQAQELVINENILLQTLGFDMQVDHPHSTVVRTSQLVKAHKDLAQTSYFLATNSLHLTTMCLQYKPSVVACVCIYLASKWSEYEIQASHEGKDWFWYVDKSITLELLENLTQDFLDILERCPSRLKQKILKWKSGHRVEETFGPPPEKRHRGDAVSEPVAGTSRTAEKKTEQSLKHKKPENVASHNQPVSKTKHSEALAGAGSHPGTPKVLPHSTNVSTPTSRSHENAIPVIKTQEVNSVAVPGVSETVAEAPSSAQMKKRDSSEKISIKDYKQYREYKEKKERESSGGIVVDRATENELRPSEQSSKQSESHRKEQYQHEKHSKSELTLKIQTPSPDVRKHDGSNLKKEKSESNLRYKAESGVNKVKKDLSVEHITMEASEVVNPLKLHIKREQGTHTVQSSGSPLKIKIKTHHSKEHKSERHSKSHDKSASDEHKPSLKLKLTEQMLKSHNQHLEKKSKHRHSDGSRESKQATASQPGSSSEKVNSNSKHSGKSRSSSKHTSEKTQAMFSPLAGGSHSFDVSGATNSVGLYGEGNGVHNPLGLSRSDSFSMSGESGVKSNGSGFHSPQIPLTPTKENLGQLNIQLQQLINQSKMQIAQQQQQQQYNHQPLLRPPPPPLPSNPIHGMFPTNYIPQVYHGGPPLPHAPPPPSPPKNPPPPPPPPHQSY